MPGLDRSWDEPNRGRDYPKLTAHGARGDQGLGHVGVLARVERLEHAAKYRAAVDAAYRASAPGGGNADQQAERTDADSTFESTSMVDKYPTDYVRTTHAPPNVDGRHESPNKWLRAVNEDENLPGRDNNCGECARAVYSTWYGKPAIAAALADPDAWGEPTPRMAEWAGVEPERITMAEIGHRLAELGPGNSAIVGCDWKDGGGHWFNAVNHADAVKTVDGQFGLVGRWPPSMSEVGFDESRVKVSDAIFFDQDGKAVPN